MGTERAGLMVSGMWRPRDRAGLRNWVRVHLKMDLPERGMCAGHCSPLDYLAHSFFEEAGDSVVWACRGGGKTMMGAVATLLELVHKPGIEVRILGGSLEQSDKMYGYLRGLMEEAGMGEWVAGKASGRRLVLENGSRVEVLAQSDTSVRGQRVQRLRCDEVELFDRGVWSAAQLVTRSTEDERGRKIRAGIEAFSTMHVPGGLMTEIVGGGRKVFSWCVWDVIEKCGEERACGSCGLWNECRGRAKEGTGFVKIDDVLAMRGRVSRGVWRHEMLCEPPRYEDAVLGSFVRGRHVRAWGGQGLPARVVLGVDFGFAGAFVGLFLGVWRDALGEVCVHVLEEVVTRELTLERSIAALKAKGMRVDLVRCDVAGRQVNAQTGKTDVRVLEEAGFAVKCRGMVVEEGLGVIEGLLMPAAGGERLWVDPKCVRLIAALEGYRRGVDGKPVKDGVHDHLVDALRYGLVEEVRVRKGVEVLWY